MNQPGQLSQERRSPDSVVEGSPHVGDNATSTPIVHGEIHNRNDTSMAGSFIASLFSASPWLILIKRLHYVIPHPEMVEWYQPPYQRHGVLW